MNSRTRAKPISMLDIEKAVERSQEAYHEHAKDRFNEGKWRRYCAAQDAAVELIRARVAQERNQVN